MASGLNMSSVYECSFPEHLAIVLVAFGQTKWLLDLANAPDPQQTILEHWPVDGDESFLTPTFSSKP